MGCETWEAGDCTKQDTNDPFVGRSSDETVVTSHNRTRREVACKQCCTFDNCNRGFNCALTTRAPDTPQYASWLAVRLLPELNKNNYEGTIEVFYNNRWGTICDSDWTDNDARVACRMLGFLGEGATAKNASTLSANVQTLLPNVECLGLEDSLADCGHGPLGSHSCGETKDAAVTCSSEDTDDGAIFMVDALNNTFIRMDVRTTSYSYVRLEGIYNPGSFDYDPTEERIYFPDESYQQINSMRFDGTDIRNVKQLNLNSKPDNVKIDPINRLLFYTDKSLNLISSMNLDGGDFQNVITTGTDTPRGLALYPETKTLYWTDLGETPKIESANYDGTNRKILVNTNLKTPNALTIDYQRHLLFFVDSGLGTIESLDLQGNNRKLLHQDSSAQFYSIDQFDKFLYFTDWSKGAPMKVYVDGSGLQYVGPPVSNKLMDIRLHSRYNTDIPGTATQSPSIFDPSEVFVRLMGTSDWSSGQVEFYANGQWGKICDDAWDDRDATVVCGMLGFDRTKAKAQVTNQQATGRGYGLNSLDVVQCTGTEDHIAKCGIAPKNWNVHNCSRNGLAGVMCEQPQQAGVPDPTFDNFVIFYDVYDGQLVKVDQKTSSFAIAPMTVPLIPVAITYSPKDQTIYFSDGLNGTSDIYVANHRGSIVRTFGSAIPTGSIIDGLAVDMDRNLLFYTDSGHGSVVSITPDGTVIKNVSTVIGKPKGVALDKKTGLVYWTDCGSPAKIERSNFDGTNRQTIVNGNLDLPNGIAVDANAGLVYFCDAGSKTIEVMNTDGTNRKVLYKDYRSQCYSITLTSKYIFYSDWAKLNIMRLNRDGTHELPVGPDTFTQIYGVYSYESGFS